MFLTPSPDQWGICIYGSLSQGWQSLRWSQLKSKLSSRQPLHQQWLQYCRCLSSGAVGYGHFRGCSRLGHFIRTLCIFKRRNSHSTYVIQFLHALIILDIVDKKLPNSNANYEKLFTHQFES